MVKDHDTGENMLSPNNEPTSIDTEGSFVVLHRTTQRDSSIRHYSNGEPLTINSPNTSTVFTSSTMDNQNSSFMASLFPPDVRPEDIQRKLRDLVQENIDLKETLHQNNLAMKQQFDTLVMWQKEIWKVHKNHREKFDETKQIIMKLRAENMELKNFVEAKAGSVSDAQLKIENAKLKGQLAELQQKLSAPMPRMDIQAAPSKKEIELNELAKQLNHQLETAERARRKLSIDVEHFNAQNIKAENEIAILKKELNEQQQKSLLSEQLNMELTQKVKQYEKNIEVGKTDEETRNKLQQEVQQLKTQLEAVKKELENAQDRLARALESKEQLISQVSEKDKLLQELQVKNNTVQTSEQENVPSDVKKSGNFTSYIESCEEKFDLLNTSLIKQTERYIVLDKWLQNTIEKSNQMKFSQSNEAAQNLQVLKQEIQELRKILMQEQAYSVEKKTNFNETQKCFQQLFGDYQTLLVEWETYNQEQKDKARHNDVYHDTQARGFIERLDRLTAEVLCKDEEIKENDKEIKQLKDKVKKLEVENEAITILKAQVEVYQSDFNAEREARENLAGEKERLAEDLRHLQRRNQQLLDELETYQRNQFDQLKVKTASTGWSTIATSGRSSISPNGKIQQPSETENSPSKVYDEDVPPPKEYICPLCKMAFRLLEHLEYHIETCLDG